MTLTEASVTFNEWAGGRSGEPFSARAWRCRWRGLWPLVLAIDYGACEAFGEPEGHCQRAHEGYRLAGMDVPERVRAAGL